MVINEYSAYHFFEEKGKKEEGGEGEEEKKKLVNYFANLSNFDYLFIFNLKRKNLELVFVVFN